VPVDADQVGGVSVEPSAEREIPEMEIQIALDCAQGDSKPIRGWPLKGRENPMPGSDI
jgi:hypothetical protein